MSKEESPVSSHDPAHFQGKAFYPETPTLRPILLPEHLVLSSKDLDEEPQVCRICGCTEDDCRRCIVKTGSPCHWVEVDLCSACVPTAQLLRLVKQIKEKTLAIGELLDNRYAGDPTVQIQNEIKRQQLDKAREINIKDLIALVEGDKP